jgi:hypothetical protein
MKSSAIEKINYQIYDITNNKYSLDITFKSGDKYRYFDVPLSVLNEFMNSDSFGKFFQKSIKNNYKYIKI